MCSCFCFKTSSIHLSIFFKIRSSSIYKTYSLSVVILKFYCVKTLDIMFGKENLKWSKPLEYVLKYTRICCELFYEFRYAVHFQPKKELQNLLLRQFSCLLSGPVGHHSSHACIQTCPGKWNCIKMYLNMPR